jgi:hypothetical protein
MPYNKKNIKESNRPGAFDKKPTNWQSIATSAILVMLIYLLNQCAAIYQCACVFTAMLLMVNSQMLNTRSMHAYRYISISVLLSLPIYILDIFPK